RGFQRLEIAGERRTVHDQDLGHLGDGRLPRQVGGDEHRELRHPYPGLSQDLVVELRDGPARFAQAEAGALPGDLLTLDHERLLVRRHKRSIYTYMLDTPLSPAVMRGSGALRVLGVPMSTGDQDRGRFRDSGSGLRPR